MMMMMMIEGRNYHLDYVDVNIIFIMKKVIPFMKQLMEEVMMMAGWEV